MGRKIPAKKHRGVKDPLKQQARRFQSLKGKINLAPSDPDDQPMPRSIERMFGLKPQNDKADKKKKLKHLNYKEDKPAAVPSKKLNPVSRMKRAVGETGRAFSARISNAVRTLVSDADMLDYPLDTEKEDVKGDQLAEWKERRRAKKRKLDKQNGKSEQDGEKKKKLHRLDLKKAAKKAKADEHIAQSRELVYERVEFGEVVAAPPALTTPPRAVTRHGAPSALRPGARDLLLTKLLNPTNQQLAQTPNSQSQASKSKKPQLSALEKERRERARQLAVEAYRQLKKSRERKQDS